MLAIVYCHRKCQPYRKAGSTPPALRKRQHPCEPVLLPKARSSEKWGAFEPAEKPRYGFRAQARGARLAP